MKPELILRSDLLDIIFEHKNKLYGAYQLRRNYPLHLWTAIGGMMLMVTACWLLAPKNQKILTWEDPSSRSCPIHSCWRLHLNFRHPLLRNPYPIQRPPSTVASIKHMVPVIVKDAVQTEVPDQTILESNTIGPVTTAGTKMMVRSLFPRDRGQEKPLQRRFRRLWRNLLPRSKKLRSCPPFQVEQLPCNAGYQDIYAPRKTRLPGEKVRVVVRFVVGPTGEIDRIQLVQQGGESFDKEVLRVINKMPKWEPGLQFGHPVAVWFTIPVIFEMPEQ